MSDDSAPWDDFKAPTTDRGPWDDYKPKPATDPNAPGLLETFARGAAHGATFGYEDKLGLSKEANDASAKANPWTHFAGEVAGGFVPVTAATLLAPEVAVPTELAAAAPWLKTAYTAARSPFVAGEIGTLGQAIKQGAKLGVSYGALAGSGNAPVSPEDTTSQALNKRLSGALTGAGEGLIYGPAFGAVGHGIYRGAQGIGAAKAAAQAETEGMGAGALQVGARKLQEDRIEPQQVIDNILSEFPSATDTAKGGMSRRYWGQSAARQPWTREQVMDVIHGRANDLTPAQISANLKSADNQFGAVGTGPGEQAVGSLLDELEQRHLGPLNLVDRAAMVRRGAGDNTQMALRAAVATPGEHVGIARENLLERQIGAGGRMSDMFGRLVGNPDFDAVAQQHSDDLKQAGQDAYTTAFAHEKPFDLNPIFNRHILRWQNRRGIGDQVNGAIADMQSSQPVVQQIPGNPPTAPGWGNAPLGPDWLPGQAATQKVANPADLSNKAPPMDLQSFIDARGGLQDKIDSAIQGGNKNLARALVGLKDDLSKEVAKTNPKWEIANDIWRDGKAGQEALDAGAAMSTRVNSASRENLSYYTDAQTMATKAEKDLSTANKALKDFTPNAGTNPAKQAQLQADVTSAQARLDAANSRQNLFRVGLVRALNDQIANSGETYNLTRQLLLPGAQKMFRTVLGDEGADQFLQALRAESAMHRTYSSQFGSQTTPLREAIDELNWAPKFDASLLNPMHWPAKALDLAHQYAARTISAARNKDLVRLYTETDPFKQLESLRAMQKVHVAGSNAGNLFGKPVVSGAAPAVESALSEQGRLDRPRVMEPYQP